MQKLLSQGEVDSLSISGSGPCTCTPCQVGNAHHLPFCALPHRASTCLHRYFPNAGTPSVGGARYFLVIGDNHTFKAIRGWLLQVKMFTGLKVKQFGTDGGGKFLSKDIVVHLSPHTGSGGSVTDTLWNPVHHPSVVHLCLLGCKGFMTILSKQGHRTKSAIRATPLSCLATASTTFCIASTAQRPASSTPLEMLCLMRPAVSTSRW